MPLEVGKLYQNKHGNLIVCLSRPIEHPLRTLPPGYQVVMALAISRTFWVSPDAMKAYTEVE